MHTPLALVPLTEHDAQALCAWRYPPPYDLFNWPSWAELLAEGLEFGDPAIRAQQYAAVIDSHGEMIGFAQLFPMEGVTRLGFGMRPDLCGQGGGARFVRAIADEALRRQPENEIDLEVLTWNIRAVRCYARAGFILTDTYERMTPTGVAAFHCMIYRP